MSDQLPEILDALVAELTEGFAPSILAADAVCPRAAGNPGLTAAQRLLSAWFAELQAGDRAGALQPARLDAALRGLLVRALSRGSVQISGHPHHGRPVLLLDPHDMAALKIVRELAATVDAASGSAITEAFDAHRERVIDRLFALATAADRARR